METSQQDMAAVSLREFNRLITDLLQGRLQRNGFRRWEIDILLDLETCKLRRSTRRETLRRYQQAMTHRLEDGEPIQVLSHYLETRRRRRRLAAISAAELKAAAQSPAIATTPGSGSNGTMPLSNLLTIGAILHPRTPVGPAH